MAKAKEKIVAYWMGIPFTEKQAEKALKEKAARAIYPDIKVNLVGFDGNVFNIKAAVKDALRKAGHDAAATQFINEAMTGDYNHVLRTCMKYVAVS